MSESSPKRVAVILAGGSGERFWPLSTPERPKQLLNLDNPDTSLLEQAIRRVQPLFAEDVFVATTAALAPTIAAANLVPNENVLAEPQPRNTLGAICWIVWSLRARGLNGETAVAILTADHAIGEEERFRSCVSQALDAAVQTGGIVTIGVPPTRPETGFGYIEVGEAAARGCSRVTEFREKPDFATAEAFVRDGGFLWNSGMFFFTLDTFERELALHCPMASRLMSSLSETFSEVPRESIDRSLLEKSSQVFVLPATFPWDDLGSWDSLDRTREKDSAGNIIVGDVAAVDTSGCIVQAAEGVHVGIIGLTDIIVVATDKGVLVCHKSQAQRVRDVTPK